jgi:Ca-activated chloride channel family protein
MMNNLEFLRPWWFLLVIPLIILGTALFKKRVKNTSWHKICDSKLLDNLLVVHNKKRHFLPFALLIASGFSMILGLCGPAWKKINIPTYQQIQPRVVLLDMSNNMYDDDLSPDRLTRAKFKLHDIFSRQIPGQFALIAYTSEPFIVSPLTDDSQTIDTLVPSLVENIMPVGGNDLSSALLAAQNLFKADAATFGDILILTSTIPDNNALATAKKMSKKGINSSIMPIVADKKANAFFASFAKAGNGKLIDYTFNSDDIDKWLKSTNITRSFKRNDLKNIPLMRDEGRYFVLLALIFMLPFFRRGYFARING